MSDDIVTRLRRLDCDLMEVEEDWFAFDCIEDAINEIERLRAQLREYTGDKHTIHAARSGTPSGVQDPSEGAIE